MYNQFRTLLLNIPDTGVNDEHITNGYAPKILTPTLSGIYKILFPPSISRSHKLFLVHNYLQVIRSAGLADAITFLDHRITYNKDSDEYFKTHRKSNPVFSDPNFPLFVHGEYTVTNEVYSDKLLIQQNIAAPTQVSIFSYGHGSYVLGSQFYDSRTFVNVAYTSPFISDDIDLNILGLRLQIGKVAGSFTDSTAKVWEVLVDAPKKFDMFKTYEKLFNSPHSKALQSIPASLEVKNYDNIWTFHQNPVYRLAGLLVAYVYRVNDL